MLKLHFIVFSLSYSLSSWHKEEIIGLSQFWKTSLKLLNNNGVLHRC